MAKNKGGRPQSENKKCHSINVVFDEIQYTIVIQNAQVANMTKTEWVRKSAILRKVIPRFSVQELKIFRDFSGVANNLNQLTKRAHEIGLLNLADQCTNTIEHISFYLNQLKSYDSENN